MSAFDDAHGLVVGIANYRHVRRLPQVRDAGDIAALLVAPELCGYRQDNVETLLDERATSAGIREGLEALALKADNNATIFIYFSGHGGRIESGPHAGEYLLPVNTVYPADEDLARTALPGNEFTEALNRIKSRKVLVILDCCHSGGIGQPRGVAAAPIVKPGLSDAFYERLKAGRGRVILASSRQDEFSYVLPGAEYGLFTEHLMGGLRGEAASDDGLVRIFDLFEYLQPRVTRAHPGQHPVFKAELEENFPVALYRGGQKGIVPKVEGDFRYDAYISYVDDEPDRMYVWEVLVPRLEAAGLKVAVTHDSEEPGVARVVGIERAIRESKRTVVVLSEAYLADNMADFQNVLGQTMGIEEGAYRLLPVRIAPIGEGRVPTRLGMLTTLDLAHPTRAEREFERLVGALLGALPKGTGR